MAGYTENVLQYIDIKVDPDPFCTSCQISTINKKAKSKITLKAKIPFKCVFTDIIPDTSSKSLTKETTFSN